jgi:hypothetical protein
MPTARRRRILGAVVASTIAHVAVLIVLALQASTLPAPVEPAGPPEAIIPILLMPKALPPPAGGAPRSNEVRLHRRAQRMPAPSVSPVAPLVTAIAPSPHAAEQPSQAAATPSPQASPPGPSQDLRAALRRGVGCANAGALKLSRAERELCDEQLGRGAASAPFLPAAIGGAKRAYYDAVAEAKKADGAPTPQRAPGVLGMFDGDSRGTNGHGPSVGCHIAFGVGPKPKPPPNALSLGPCYIEPPKGPLSTEVDITPP